MYPVILSYLKTNKHTNIPLSSFLNRKQTDKHSNNHRKKTDETWGGEGKIRESFTCQSVSTTKTTITSNSRMKNGFRCYQKNITKHLKFRKYGPVPLHQ